MPSVSPFGFSNGPNNDEEPRKECQHWETQGDRNPGQAEVQHALAGDPPLCAVLPVLTFVTGLSLLDGMLKWLLELLLRCDVVDRLLVRVRRIHGVSVLVVNDHSLRLFHFLPFFVLGGSWLKIQTMNKSEMMSVISIEREEGNIAPIATCEGKVETAYYLAERGTIGR